MLDKIKRLNHRHLIPDVLLIAASFYVSLWLRVGLEPDFAGHLKVLNKYIILFVVLRAAVFLATGVYDIIWRYISLHDALKIVRAILLSSLIIIAATYIVDIGRLPRSMFFIDVSVSVLFLAGVRFSRRLLREYQIGKQVKENAKRTLIVGAGVSGRNLATRLSTDNDTGLRLMGFIDDDPQKVGRMIAGNRVWGNRAQLADYIREFSVNEVIVAMSRPPAEALRNIMQVCRNFKIQPRLVRGVAEQTLGKSIETFQNVELGDLLNRPPKTIDNKSIRELVSGKTVLVTGAGGSIGSELARQILAFKPMRLLLLDHSEYNLYTIDQELRGNQTENSNVLPLLVDVKDKRSLATVFKKYRPEIVFHAAAYKHVHLVEANPATSILNNILGTRNLLDLSVEQEVSNFVLISTDKAVNPVGVMGATKRVCELMVAQVGRELNKHYCSVRFGNVLGSSGSLIPLLTQQIKDGRPITITHPDMSRYFMLISEAVALVLKAATITGPGNIAILDMGEPVRIVDLAKSLYALIGDADREAPLVFTGQRPGEKLFEELYLCGNEIKTEHDHILLIPHGDTANFLGDEFHSRVGMIVQLAGEGKAATCVDLVHRLVKSDGVATFIEPERPASLSAGFVTEAGLNE